MRIDITYDKQYLFLSSDYPVEITAVRNAFTCEIKNAWLLKKKSKLINTQRCFVSDHGYMPIGLWMDLLSFCKVNNIYCELSPNLTNYLNSFNTLSLEDFKQYIAKTFEGAETPDGEPFAPYGYQVEAAYSLLRFNRSTAEISTSGGKTLIAFIIFKYLIDRVGVNKILYIVPSVDLAEQSDAKFQMYESWLKVHHHNWQTGILKSGLRVKDKRRVDPANILFGTYQSLMYKDPSFFEPFNACILDESHHISAASNKKIISQCNNLKYSIGFTGTYPKDGTIDCYALKSYIGPKVYTLSSDELINKEKQATPIYLIFTLLDWASQEEKKMLWDTRNIKSQGAANIDYTIGSKLLRHEAKFINSSAKRMKYICDLAIKQAHNTLLLFTDIKGGYGKRIYEYIRTYSDKTVFYIDGSTDPEKREYYKSECEKDDTGNTILVASVGTFGEGIDICNIWSIFLVNSSKSERLVRQICGRGFRKYPGKDKTLIYDFVDDLRYSETGKYMDNYIWSHYKERRKTYKEQNFPYFEQPVTIKDSYGFT